MAIKLIFFDLEGTLIYNNNATRIIDGSLWAVIPHVLGGNALKVDEELYAKWHNGGYANYVEWCDESMKNFRAHRLTRDLFERLAKEGTLRDGVVETIRKLHEKGIARAPSPWSMPQASPRESVDSDVAFSSI